LDTAEFSPTQCKAVFVEADAQYDLSLDQLEMQYRSAVETLASTAMYSCEPLDGLQAEFLKGRLKRPGSAGRPVKTLNLMRFLSERALQKDHVVVKIDVGGAEWDVLPCLARSSAARLVDVMYVHSYDPQMGSFGTLKKETGPVLQRLHQLGIKVMETAHQGHY
jgi:hypothetical protein